jgi:hypothetical protein
MSTPVIRYPLDPTGVSPNNLVSGEIQTMPARAVRAITPDYGGFFTESLQITDQSTGLLLTSSQYYATELLEVPTGLYGMEICSIIMVTDPSVSNTVSLTYQCLGGEYSTSTSAIVNLVNALELDDRPVTWPAILGKPSGFPPSAHLHSAGDLYGFEYKQFMPCAIRSCWVIRLRSIMSTSISMLHWRMWKCLLPVLSRL